MQLAFHPLADLFPLIEGAEFDELVSSIKENGQLEPIVTLDNAILDGRNRYRACNAAGVPPCVEPFRGTDPVRFVVARNIHRRHLSESQRALIAANFATMSRGDNLRKAQDDEISSSTMTLQQASDAFQVSRDSIVFAKKVLAHGTPEEIQLVRNGSAAVSTISKGIDQQLPPEERKRRREMSETQRHQPRAQTQARHAEIWSALSNALTGLTGLPLPSDVAAIAHGHVSRRLVVNAKITPALDWLMEFSDAWNARRD